MPTNRDLEINALSVDAYHDSTLLFRDITELDTHSLYGVE